MRSYIAATSHDLGMPIGMLQEGLRKLEEAGVAASGMMDEGLLPAMHAALEILTIVRRKAINMHKLSHDQTLQPERASGTLRTLLDKVYLLAYHGSTPVPPRHIVCRVPGCTHDRSTAHS